MADDGGIVGSINNSKIVYNTQENTTNKDSSPHTPSPRAAVVDSGTTGNYLTKISPCLNKTVAVITLPIELLNGEIIHLFYTTLLKETELLLQSRKLHIFPGLTTRNSITNRHLL